MEPNELLLSVLDEEAWEYAPRKAIMWQPGMTWHAESAEDLLQRQRTFGDARLVWLHKPDRPTKGDYDLAGG
jgi:hypothetical protein